ncbi:MAG: hypothetical protein QOJ32_3046, partial [Frankiaceae bacterium]|nr:hypothetical protein [Frankiaceae bacterium]
MTPGLRSSKTGHSPGLPVNSASIPMPVTALLDAALADPSLARWVADAGTPTLDLTAPPGM